MSDLTNRPTPPARVSLGDRRTLDAPAAPRQERETVGPGDVVGDLRIDAAFEGGMGRVLLATALTTGRKVALKMPRPDVVTDPATLESFRAEALRWIDLGSHPNVVAAHRLDSFLGLPALHLEPVEGGRTLAHELREGKTDWRRAVVAGFHVASGLDFAAWVSGLVHRDLKPSNVLVDPDGVAKVSDLGISFARWTEGDARARSLAGTPGYIAPEILAGTGAASVRSDVYALGAILFELATGRAPYPARAEWAALVHDHCERPVPDPRSVRADVPERLAALVVRCLAKAPRERPVDLRAVARELRLIHEERLGPVVPVSWTPPSAVEALVARAATALEVGGVAVARRLAEEALRAGADDVEANLVLGSALIRSREPREATRRLEVARDRAPDAIEPERLLALAHLAAGERELARRAFGRALELARAQKRLATLEGAIEVPLRLDGPRAALALADEILAERATAIHALYNKACLAGQLGDHAETLACSERVLAINPAFAKAWVTKGTALLNLGRLEDALAAARTALALDRDAIPAIGLEATALACLGRTKDAREGLLRALERQPEAQVLREYLARITSA